MNILGHAAKYLGIKEIPGSKHTSVIVSMLRDIGIRRGGDETPWCAAFVNRALSDAGVEGTGSGMARSFMRWGTPVAEPQLDDIVVLWRKSRKGPYGHVGFFLRFEGNRVVLLGGNQRNSVSHKSYHKSRILGVRRLEP